MSTDTYARAGFRHRSSRIKCSGSAVAQATGKAWRKMRRKPGYLVVDTYWPPDIFKNDEQVNLFTRHGHLSWMLLHLPDGIYLRINPELLALETPYNMAYVLANSEDQLEYQLSTVEFTENQVIYHGVLVHPQHLVEINKRGKLKRLVQKIKRNGPVEDYDCRLVVSTEVADDDRAAGALAQVAFFAKRLVTVDETGQKLGDGLNNCSFRGNYLIWDEELRGI